MLGKYLSGDQNKKSAKTDIANPNKSLSAKSFQLLDYFFKSNESNINQGFFNFQSTSKINQTWMGH